MAQIVTAGDLLDGHAVLDIECLDRVYLNGYVPKLQAGGQVVTFLHGHLGKPIASPALIEQIGTIPPGGGAFARPTASRWSSSARRPQDRRDAPAAGAAGPHGRSGVAAVGWAQEFQQVWDARKRDTDPGRRRSIPCQG